MLININMNWATQKKQNQKKINPNVFEMEKSECVVITEPSTLKQF